MGLEPQTFPIIIVTVPLSGKGVLEFKCRSGRIYFGHQVVQGLKSFMVADLLVIHFQVVVVKECTEALGHWNLC